MTAVVIHMAATWAMVGFAWTIQILQYPLMAAVPAEVFPEFEAHHQRRVVAVLAIFAPLELVMAAVVFLAVPEVPGWLSLSSGLVLAVIWVSTGLFYAPIHGRLGSGFDRALHQRLVTTNWLRTIGWTARGVAAASMVAFF